MTNIRTFDSFDDLARMIQQDQAIAAAIAQPWQEALTFGDFFVRLEPSYGIIIYGEVIDPIKGEIEAGVTGEDLESVKALYVGPHRRYLRFTNCFSQICPDGELGDMYVSTAAAKITKEQFEKARADGWPCTIEYLINDLKVQRPEE